MNLEAFGIKNKNVKTEERFLWYLVSEEQKRRPGESGAKTPAEL